MDSLTPCPSPAPFQNLNKYDVRNPTHLLQLSLVVMEVVLTLDICKILRD